MLLAGLFALASCLQDSWQELKSEEGAFTIQLPGKPEASQQAVSEAGVKVTCLLWILSTQGGMTYAVSSTKYPPGQHDGDRIQAKTLEGFLKSVKGKSTSQAKADFQGTKATICQFTTAEGANVGEVRVYFVEGKLYQVAALSAKDTFKKDDAKKVFDSLKVLDK